MLHPAYHTGCGACRTDRNEIAVPRDYDTLGILTPSRPTAESNPGSPSIPDYDPFFAVVR